MIDISHIADANQKSQYFKVDSFCFSLKRIFKDWQMLINFKINRMNDRVHRFCCAVSSEITGQILCLNIITSCILKSIFVFRGLRDLPSYCERNSSLKTSWFSFSRHNTQDSLRLTNYNIELFSLMHCKCLGDC